MKDKLLISFVGPSGSGKSTCFVYAKNHLEHEGMWGSAYRADVAYPLRLIQAHAYELFKKESPGEPHRANFKQDGQLLGFLAKHFESQLGVVIEERVKELLGRSGRVAVINTDCRNNAYETLNKLGFVFVRLAVSPDILKQRRLNRGDITTFNHKADVEKYNEIKTCHVIPNDRSLEELKENVGFFLEEMLKE